MIVVVMIMDEVSGMVAGGGVSRTGASGGGASPPFVPNTPSMSISPSRALGVAASSNTGVSCPEQPQVMLSVSLDVPHTMLSTSPLVPQTMLSASSCVPQTMLSSSPCATLVPHTMLSQSA